MICETLTFLCRVANLSSRLTLVVGCFYVLNDLSSDPLVKLGLSEAPSAPHFKGWDLTFGHQPVSRALANPEVSSYFIECEDGA